MKPSDTRNTLLLLTLLLTAQLSASQRSNPSDDGQANNDGEWTYSPAQRKRDQRAVFIVFCAVLFCMACFPIKACITERLRSRPESRDATMLSDSEREPEEKEKDHTGCCPC